MTLLRLTSLGRYQSLQTGNTQDTRPAVLQNFLTQLSTVTIVKVAQILTLNHPGALPTSTLRVECAYRCNTTASGDVITCTNKPSKRSVRGSCYPPYSLIKPIFHITSHILICDCLFLKTCYEAVFTLYSSL